MKIATERAEAARVELAAALDAIEDKLNVPKQLGILNSRARDSWESNRVPWLIGATAAIIVVGGIITWAILRDD